MKIIELTNGGQTLVDDEDYETFNRFRWHRTKNGWQNVYAVRTGKKALKERTTIGLHREIMNTPAGFFIDHIDGNGLNNQKSNLRNCTARQNVQNGRKTPKWFSSDFKGVSRDKWEKRWKAGITNNGKLINLGWFDDEIEAAKAYDKAARKFFGEFARPNFPAISPT